MKHNKKRSDYKGVEKVCICCGKKYVEVPNRKLKYCSMKCYSTHKKRQYFCKQCGEAYVTTPTRNIVFCSRICMFKFNLGKHRGEDVGRKISIAKLAGKEPTESKRMRKLVRFQKVRKQMLERDSFTCQICFESGIDAHHILPIKDFPEFAYDIDNLVTLCKRCHDKKVSHKEMGWVKYFKKIVKTGKK